MIVCAASNNAGKLKELRRILERMGHEVKSLRELGINLDPEETGTTFVENARIKAEAFCKASGLPTVADDSGLCTDALHGAPGVYSARYAGHHGDDDANNAKLLRELADVPEEQRGAKFVSAVCFMLPDGRALEVEGECPAPTEIYTIKRRQFMALTSKQRAALRSAANTMDPVYQIGKGEIDDTLKQGIADCIAARELIKVKVLENSEYSAREAADILCEALDCECVQVIGRKFVLFKQKKKESAYTAVLAK